MTPADGEMVEVKDPYATMTLNISAMPWKSTQYIGHRLRTVASDAYLQKVFSETKGDLDAMGGFEEPLIVGE